MSETPASPPTVSSQPKMPPATWLNPWYVLFFSFLAAYILYVAVILGRTTNGPEEPVPRSLNAIALTALSMAATLCFMAAGRLRRAREHVAEQAQLGEWMGSVMQSLADLQERARDRGDTTEDLGGRGRSRIVYASIASTNGGQIAAFGDALTRQVDMCLDRFRAGVAATIREADERIDGRLADIEALAGNQPSLNGNVVNWPLTPR